MKRFNLGSFTSILTLILALVSCSQAHAQSFGYPGVHYINPYSQSMGGVTVPISNEIGNNLFNNPAGLARNEKFKAEFLNLDVDASGNMISGISTGMTSLGGFASTLNSHQNSTYAAGVSNLTALSWGGLGVGLLFQERVRAYSDGTDVHYQALSNLIPAVGYGLSLARGVVRLGYSLQYVNEAYGVNQATADSSASYLSGLAQGHGFSNNVSVDFSFPFTYLPTFTLMARNIGGLHFTSGSLFTRATNVNGLPADEAMSVDAAFNFTVRLSGSLKSFWFVEADDVTNSVTMPFMERLRVGLEIAPSQAFAFRVGSTGGQYSAGIGFRSESSEINVSTYHDRSPFPGNGYWDTRYALQYKVFFQDHNKRDRDAEEKATKGR